ncbi:MAG TPA: prolyl oligopeptidase family serine peptidase, partial [Terriglobales bacterium]|nr:prolyl oligopeptidase family serine peptidase [Terriglobales bacterium]
DQDGDRPRWAPDGKRFAFISTKDGGSQVWIADFDGGAGSVTGIHKLTSIATEAAGELWSPDGAHILFTSDVYPECDGAPAAEEACNAKKSKEAEESKVQAIIFDRLLYRHWDAYKRGKRSHIFVVEAPPEVYPTAVAGLIYKAPRDLTPGDYDAPVFSLEGQDEYAFSPDGQEICYTSNHDEVEATSTNNDLWIVPVNMNNGATGASPVQAKNITADNPASDSTPLYSPDGKYIAYRAQQRPGYESDRFRLMLYDRKTGEKKNLTEHFDNWVGTFTWSPDSKRIYFVSQTTGGQPIQSLAVDQSGTVDPSFISFVQPTNLGNDNKPGAGKHKTPFFVEDYNDDIALTRDGGTLVFTSMSLQAPNEIYKINLQKEVEEPLTHLNDHVLSQVAMSPLEPFRFEGAKGDHVQGFLVKPPNFDATKKYPVKFLIHGGPEGAWGDDWSYRWNPELFAANGYVVIMINFHGSTGYGQKFIDAINGDWGGAPFEDLMKGLDYAEKTYPFIDKDPRVRAGRQLRRIHGQLGAWPHRPLQVHRLARRHVQQRLHLGHHRRTLVQ